jgi:hypothetical protein
MKDLESTFRFSQEGLQWLFPYITKRKVTISETEFFNLLDNKDPLVSTFAPETQRTLDLLGNFTSNMYKKYLFPLEPGALIFVLGPNCKNEGWSGYISQRLLEFTAV